MGVTWRRFSERFKEKTGASKPRGFVANKRNLATLHELSSFAAQLKRFEKDLRALKVAGETALKTTRDTLNFPLPRIFEDDVAAAGGSHGQPAAIIAGGGLNTEAVSTLSLDAGRKLEEDVLTPLVRWLSAYNFVVSRNKDLENLRLEVDSRKRTVDELSAKVEALRAGAPEGAGSKAQAQLDRTVLKLQHKWGKMNVALEQYERQEGELHLKLSALAADGVWVRNYACAALCIEGAMLHKAGEAVGMMDPAAVPPPVRIASPAPATPPSAGAAGAGAPAPAALREQRAYPPAALIGAGGAASGSSSNLFGNPFLSQEPALAPGTPMPPAAGADGAGWCPPGGGGAAAAGGLEGAPSPPRHRPQLPALVTSEGGRKEGPQAHMYTV